MNMMCFSVRLIAFPVHLITLYQMLYTRYYASIYVGNDVDVVVVEVRILCCEITYYQVPLFV